MFLPLYKHGANCVQSCLQRRFVCFVSIRSKDYLFWLEFKKQILTKAAEKYNELFFQNKKFIISAKDEALENVFSIKVIPKTVCLGR